MARAGGDRRGSASHRRARKLWLLSAFGDGACCPCTFCGRRLTFATVESDRIRPNGPYRRANVQPACRQCNVRRANCRGWTPPLVLWALALAGFMRADERCAILPAGATSRPN